MNSSEARTSDTRTSEASSVINVNFLGQGIKGVKELRERALKLLNQSPNSTDLPNAQRLLNKSFEDNPENYLVKPTPPTQPRPNTSRPGRTRMLTAEDYKQIFLNSNRVLEINSVNCGFKIVNNNFYKVQISEVADPLINEVVFSMELTEAMKKKNNPNIQSIQNIFPVYYDHFTLTGAELLNQGNQLLINKKIYDMQSELIQVRGGDPNLIYQNMRRIEDKIEKYNRILQYKTFKCLVTEALNNPISLEDKINNALRQTSGISIILDNINILMTNYKYYGETLGFIHSDLHMSNIQVDQDQVNQIDNYKIIDFGRCFMFDEETKKQKYLNETNINKNIFNKFNIKNKLDFSNPFRLVNLIDKNKTSASNIKDRYICKQYAYLCDVAQVAFGLLMDKVMFNKPWFKLIKYNNCNKSYLEINLKNLDISQFTTLDDGLLWLSCYLISCTENIYRASNGRKKRFKLYFWYSNLYL
jgi:hypothetical protein